MEKIYTDPKKGFGGINKLKRRTKLKGDVKQFLEGIEAYTLTKPRRNKFPRTRVITLGIDFLWQYDLIDMQSLKSENDSFTFILIGIDTFSKKIEAMPVKDKGAQTMRTAMEKMIGDKKIKFIQTDKGNEFYARPVRQLFEEKNIIHYSTEPPMKAAIVERAIRTFRTLLFRYLLHKFSRRYLEVIPDIVANMNDSYHRSIKMKPNEVNKTNEAKVLDTLYPALPPWPEKTAFKPGDIVRISRERTVFEKTSFGLLWSNEFFKVAEIVYSHPITYRITDMKGEMIKGRFYEQELQKATYSDIYRIEGDPLKRRTYKGKKQVLIKWQGFKDPEWIDEASLVLPQ